MKPTPPSFGDDAVNLPLLRERAFNLRWATQPPGTLALTAADPDFPVAPEIREAIRRYTDGGLFSYGPAEGLPDFRKTVAHTLRDRKQIDCPWQQILPTNSAAEGLFLVARFALQPGDEAIIFDPVDFLFKKSVEVAGGKAVYCPLDSKTARFDPAELAALITPRTRLIGICNPHNPLGHVLSRAELEAIGQLALEHNLWILSDEIWSDIVFDPSRHLSTASLSPEIAARTLSVFGFSKSFGLAGLRVGYIAAPSPEVYQALLGLSLVQTTANGVSTLSQVAATAAYAHCWYWVEAFLVHLRGVRDYAWQRLNQMPGLSCRKPEGTYLLFPDITPHGMSSEAMAAYLATAAKVAVVPGAPQWFGPGAEGHIRICFSTSMGIVREALDRIEAALEKL